MDVGPDLTEPVEDRGLEPLVVGRGAQHGHGRGAGRREDPLVEGRRAMGVPEPPAHGGGADDHRGRAGRTRQEACVGRSDGAASGRSRHLQGTQARARGRSWPTRARPCRHRWDRRPPTAAPRRRPRARRSDGTRRRRRRATAGRRTRPPTGAGEQVEPARGEPRVEPVHREQRERRGLHVRMQIDAEHRPVAEVPPAADALAAPEQGQTVGEAGRRRRAGALAAPASPRRSAPPTRGSRRTTATRGHRPRRPARSSRTSRRGGRALARARPVRQRERGAAVSSRTTLPTTGPNPPSARWFARPANDGRRRRRARGPRARSHRPPTRRPSTGPNPPSVFRDARNRSSNVRGMR